jgi:Flp pilus assembly protein TadG
VRRRDDQGTVLLLTVGLSVVLMALVGVVVDVSAAALAKRSLAAAADGAAVAAAQQANRRAVRDGRLGDTLLLSGVRVRQTVATYAARARTTQAGLQMSARVEGGTEAVVTATRTVRLPFTGFLRAGSVRLHAVARARSPITP